MTVIACHLVQVVGKRLGHHGEHSSRSTLRHVLEGQQRVTVILPRADAKILHVRKRP